GARDCRDRNQIAEGALQFRLRLFHRNHEIESGERATALHAQANNGRRRALYYAGIEGNGGKNSGRGRACEKSGVFAFSKIARGNANGTWTVAKNSGRDRNSGCDLFAGRNSAPVPLLPSATG